MPQQSLLHSFFRAFSSTAKFSQPSNAASIAHPTAMTSNKRRRSVSEDDGLLDNINVIPLPPTHTGTAKPLEPQSTKRAAPSTTMTSKNEKKNGMRERRVLDSVLIEPRELGNPYTNRGSMSSDSREPPGEPPRKRPRRAIAEPSLSSDTQDNTSVSSKSVFSLFSELSQQESETPLDTEWESSSESVSEGENSTGEDTDLKDALKRKTKTPATDPPDSAFNRMMNTAKTKDKSPKPTKPEYPKRLKDLPAKGIDTSLPPLSGTREIFSDITKTALKNGLTPILNKLQGRPIRVATLCSGTESPLLALNMIQGCLQELIGKSFTVEHVFSAEIEGWKQAYIERNFHPPYIFRDVVELLEAGKDDFKATTAYGAKVDVPGDIDILIAGTSCVDLSRKNNKQKTLEDDGESGDTFRALLAYCNVRRPTLVIVENVQNAKWDYMVHKFNNLDYDADAVLLNTADYYIPHIRHRGYMLCIDRERAGKDGIGATYKWTQLMDRFRRRASVPVTEFLLADDDPRVLRARSAISKLEKKTSKESSWYTCEARGNEEREKYQLGDLRPLTNWTVSGVAEVPEGFVVEWFRPQSKRVYEFIDIAWLRNVLNERGAFDSRFKTRCWDVSQNIDLQKDNQAFGITQCITPTGDVLITNRGRAFTGYESLRLQGIPIDDLSFTIEGNKRLLDLAGNAMTATVVGPSLLAALIVAGEKLTKSRPTVQLSPAKDAAQQSLGIRSTATTTSHVTLGTQKTFNFSNMILDADRSASYCRCEGPYITSRAPVLRCEVCDHTTCQKCSGPKHSYGPNALGADERMDAIEFENKWRHHFPPILRVFGTPDVKSLCEAQGSQLGNIGDAIQDHITNAFNEPVNFQGFRRGPCWTATYQSSTVTLMLLIREAPEWQLSLKPHPALPGNSQVRRILEWPIARAKVSDSLHTIDSTWEWRIPMQQVFDFKVTALGESLPSWRARGGLLEAAGETVPSGFEITAPEGLTKLLHEDLSGVYRLFDNCATPCDILYRQTQSDGHSPLYLFLECSDIGDPALDRLVFARQTQSQNSKIKPEILAVLPKGWRPWSSKLTARSTIKVDLCATWTSSDNARISVKAVELPIELSKPRSSSDVFLPDNSCTNALTMLSTNFSDASLGHRWKLSQRIKVDDKEFWSAFSSLLFPHHELPSLREWTNVSSDGRSGHCSNCAPATPTLQWRWDTTKSSVDKDDKLVSFEDAREAGLFERKFKQRPPLFAIQLSSEAKSVTVKLAVNLHALIHRVSALLEHLPTSPVFSWRILHDHVPGVMADFLPFVSTGTNGDKSFNGPLDLNIPLRLEQLRSLTWMRNCESDHASPFLVEAIEEAILPEMRWRAEARVQKATQVKGGVLADRVGFGKTALILALIESDLRELDAVRASSPDNSTLANQQTAGLIPLCGTLVIVPKQMPLEWKNEITKFLPPARFSGRNLVIVNTPKDLNGLTVQDFQDAKIVVVNWTVLEHDSYIKALAGFAAMPEPSSTKGRSFATWMRSASGRMTEHVGLLKRLGNKDFDKEARSRYRDNSSSDEFQRVVPTKRKKGAKYISANARQMAQPSVTNSGETPLQPAGHGSKGPWTNRSYPLFHMFGWRRVVVDEFPYLNSNNLASISSLQTDRRWVLSATPKLTDFMEVKKVGELLGVDLGPDAVPEGASPTRLKQLLAEKTQAEVFHIYREIKSPEWAEARHQYAQRFVDTFVRQNETDVDNIEVEEHLCPSTLSAEWRILYEETLRHFTSKGMELIKPDSESTAPQRLISSLMSDCNSAEEVLLRTVLNPRSNDEAGGPLTFAHLEEERQNDLIASETRVSDLLYRCWGLRNYLRDEKLPKWDDWEANEADLGDADATRRLRGILTRVKKQSNTVKGNHEDLRKSVQKLREECYGGLLLCVRTLRSLQALLRLQEASVNTTLCDGARCSGNHSVDEVYLLPACGHLVCDVCHDAGTVNNKCVAPGCRSDLDGKGLIGRSDIALPSRSDLPVTKIESIVTVLQGLSKDDQALIFVQGDTMTDVVAAGLSDADIKHKAIRSSAEDIGAVADDFRADSNIKALVLDFESGAGLNLQSANHVLFVTPYLTDTNEDYATCMQQAIGRAVRPGQLKTVNVYRFVTLNTIDVDILAQRERRASPLAMTEAMDVRAESVRSSAAEKESVVLVEDVAGRFAMVPESWLSSKGRLFKAAQKSHTSLTMFSEKFAGE